MTTALTTEYARLYSASSTPEILVVPDLTYIMIDGSGPPTTQAFEAATKAIYQVSYNMLGEAATPGEQRTMPLQALWGPTAQPQPGNRATWRWTLMLLQPSLQGQDIAGLLAQAVRRIGKLTSALPVNQLYAAEFSEGRCVQALHVGPYDCEATTITRMLAHAGVNGYTPSGRHHEIYLSDPGVVAPQWLRTILRLPIEQAAPIRPA